MKKPSKKFQIENNKLIKYTGRDMEVIIPDNVHMISSNAFVNNKYIESVVFPDGLLSIEDNAFVNCDNLFKVSFENIDVPVSANWYKECISLTTITIRKSIINVGDYNYYGNVTLDVKFVTKTNQDGEQDFICDSIESMIDQHRNYDKAEKVLKKSAKNQRELIKIVKNVMSISDGVGVSGIFEDILSQILEVSNRTLELIKEVKFPKDADKVSSIRDKLHIIGLTAYQLIMILDHDEEIESVSSEIAQEIFEGINEVIISSQKGMDIIENLFRIEEEAILKAHFEAKNYLSNDDLNDDDNFNDDNFNFNNNPIMKWFQ